MTPEKAAEQVDEKLRPKAWYVSTGVGATVDGPALFVYVKSGRHRELANLERSGVAGFPVLIRVTGGVRALRVG